ncbi:MAG: SGNH/GDSL hydrolase family protein [Clostridiaceae bacterium]|nr:SGNH/GDSL hydrolase family protein [Clostridiaceae bacterium]
MRILFQGDSITDGNRLKTNECDLNHQIGHSYAYLVTSQWSFQNYNKQLKFINRGISGNRIFDLYARLQEDVLKIEPDVLSILIGVNDVGQQVKEKAGHMPKRFEKAYRMLLDDVLEERPNCRIVLCEPFILPVAQVKEQYELWNCLISEVQASIGRIAEDYPVLYIPLQEKFNKLASLREPEYWLWDGVHPTEAGHQMIANEWMAAVSPWVTNNA